MTLLTNWFFKACNRALQGEAKRKYFEHAGALLTADGTDDNLIKFEGTPSGYQIKIVFYFYVLPWYYCCATVTTPMCWMADGL